MKTLLTLFVLFFSFSGNAEEKSYKFYKDVLLSIDLYPDYLNESDIIYGEYSPNENEFFFVGFCASRAFGLILLFSIEDEKPVIHYKNEVCVDNIFTKDFNDDDTPELVYLSSGGGSGLSIAEENIFFYKNKKDKNFEVFSYETSWFEHRGPRLDLPIELSLDLLNKIKDRAEKNTWKGDHGIYTTFSQNTKITFLKNTFPSDNNYKKEITTIYEFEYVHDGDKQEGSAIKNLGQEILKFIIDNSNFKATKSMFGRNCESKCAIKEVKIINRT